MITRDEAEAIAAQWANADAGTVRYNAGLHEFDLGYVVWREPPPGAVPEIGAPRGIIDRETGELSLWPSLPLDTVVDMFREHRASTPRAPHTWDPAGQARRDLVRAPFPCNVSELTLASGRVLRSRSMRGDGRPDLHHLVRGFFAEQPPNTLERGYDRHAEVAVLSDALHAEDTSRAAAGDAPVTLDGARTGLFRGAGIVTYRVREPDDPAGGESGPPSVSSLYLLAHLGFELRPPREY